MILLLYHFGYLLAVKGKRSVLQVCSSGLRSSFTQMSFALKMARRNFQRVISHASDATVQHGRGEYSGALNPRGRSRARSACAHVCSPVLRLIKWTLARKSGNCSVYAPAIASFSLFPFRARDT